ncbi:MAG TPA: N-6 DNA methylase, partial [Gemmatimonadales bacterium]|nr:N-6 DNA methylase [Gemmatimonadales bacterium]
MSLASVLRATGALTDLPRLVAELGHEPLWEELPPWPDVLRAATVGRHGRFLWIGAESGRPVSEVVRGIAKRFSSNGCAAGVLVVYPAGRELGIAAGFGEPTVLRIGLDGPAPVALASLRRLSGLPPRSAAAFAARAADALAGRGIGHEFFRQFRTTVELAAGAVAGRALRDPSHRRSLALLQLTRVLFLYFVQSRGWLDGRLDFLRRAVDECLMRRRSLQRHLFDPLFFGTLNRSVESRTRGVRSFGVIPFLNGGLFEPHPLERRYGPALPDSVWRESFDRLFERYHFTVSESEGTAAAVAPDMLGRVFEGVMEPADRKASGTFYTPAALVKSLVDATCAALVGTRLGCRDAEAAALIALGDRAALNVLATATILDPACGSGAFLLGALERMAAVRIALGEPPGTVRRSVLQRQLFGVDLSGMAVRLAELRLWLSVVAHDDSVDACTVRPLPNLDCLVRQGDSLLEPASARVTCSTRLARAAGETRLRIVTAVGAEKARLASSLRKLELTAAVESADIRVQRASERIAELIQLLRAPTLFGDRAAPSAEQRRNLRELRAELRAARAARRAIASAGDIPWFQYESHFPDIMHRGGFDIVIGNPPWVRAEEIPAEMRQRLAGRYRWWRTPQVRGFAHRPDLAVAFLERAHELAAPRGVVTQLVPAKVATASYGSAARASLVRETTVHAAADLTGEASARFGATVYPMAIITSRRPAPKDHVVRHSLDLESGGVPQHELDAAPWAPDRRNAGATAARLRGQFPLFSSRFACRLGVKTGANDIFLDPSTPDTSLLRAAIRGRDLAPFSIRPGSKLLWTHDEHGTPLASLPAEPARYLARHEARLRSRADFAGGPYWTLFRTRGALAPHRVVWSDLARELAAAVPPPGAVALNTCYVIHAATDLEGNSACAWLNSTWIRAVARLVAPPASGGFARFTAGVVGSLPAPADDPELARLGGRG